MSLAEQLYKERTVSHVNYDFYAASSIWIDTLFILTIAMIHLIYSAKFTVFSLAYLKAKCEEKKTQTTWSESKLYLHTVCCSDPHLFMKDGDDEKQIYCTLWMDLSFIHNVVRALLNPQNLDNFCLFFEAKYGGKCIIKIEDSKHRRMFKVW
eukprot:193949_1